MRLSFIWKNFLEKFNIINEILHRSIFLWWRYDFWSTVLEKISFLDGKFFFSGSSFCRGNYLGRVLVKFSEEEFSISLVFRRQYLMEAVFCENIFLGVIQRDSAPVCSFLGRQFSKSGTIFLEGIILSGQFSLWKCSWWKGGEGLVGRGEFFSFLPKIIQMIPSELNLRGKKNFL